MQHPSVAPLSPMHLMQVSSCAKVAEGLPRYSYEWAHLVQAGQRPGGRVGVGGGLGRGAGCCKAAAVQAGAQVAILHLQGYAYMQVEGLGLCQTQCRPRQSLVNKELLALQHFRLTCNGGCRGGFWAVSLHSHPLFSGYKVSRSAAIGTCTTVRRTSFHLFILLGRRLDRLRGRD